MRELFGDWGVALSDGEFAAAVARRLESARAEWRASLDDYWPWWSRFWPYVRETWTNVAPEASPPFSVPARRVVLPPLDLLEDVDARFAFAALHWARLGVDHRHPLVIYTPDVEHVPHIAWPLRVGVLGDFGVERVVERLNARAFIEASAVRPDLARYDILFATTTLQRALVRLATAASPPRATLLVVTERGADLAPRLVATLATSVRKLAGAAALVVGEVGAADDDRSADHVADWIKRLTDELAHDLPLDHAAYAVPAPRPLVFSTRDVLEATRVSRRVLDLADKLERASDAFAERVLAVDGFEGFDRIQPDGPDAVSIAKALRDQSDLLRFDQERTGATGAANLFMAMEPTLSAAAEAAEPRYLQTLIREGNETSNRLLAGRTYALDVWIGAQGKVARANALAEPFPPVPDDGDSHELQVVFEEPHLLSQPQRATIRLPAVGDSAKCSFFFHAKHGVEALYARIIVLHRGRVLQTGVLRGRIGVHEKDEAGELTFEPDALIRRRLQTLGSRSQFGASFVANHDDNGVPTKLGVLGERVVRINLTEKSLTALSTRFNAAISDIAQSPKKYETLRSDGNVALLRDLAQHGSVLHYAIFEHHEVNGQLESAPRIQIVTARYDGFLPLELAYRFEAPDEGAELCAGAEEALKNGSCPATCGGGTTERICPLGFWCTSKVIERYAHRAEHSKDGDVHDLFVEPIGKRAAIARATRGLVAASNNASEFDDKAISRIVDRLSECGVPSKTATTWDEWAKLVEADRPSLLVLLPHHLQDAGSSLLEIGRDSRLKTTLIRTKHVVGDPEPTPLTQPIVLLLGCETKDAVIALENAAAAFQRRKAVIVLATIATVLGRHASPTAAELIGLLNDVTGDRGFGDVVLAARRRLLAAGRTMALALAAFGDADWKLA